MCIICSSLDNNTMTTWEARRAVTEVIISDPENEHTKQVVDKIKLIEYNKQNPGNND